jgi:hypothetical protein
MGATAKQTKSAQWYIKTDPSAFLRGASYDHSKLMEQWSLLPLRKQAAINAFAMEVATASYFKRISDPVGQGIELSYADTWAGARDLSIRTGFKFSSRKDTIHEEMDMALVISRAVVCQTSREYISNWVIELGEAALDSAITTNINRESLGTENPLAESKTAELLKHDSTRTISLMARSILMPDELEIKAAYLTIAQACWNALLSGCNVYTMQKGTLFLYYAGAPVTNL